MSAADRFRAGVENGDVEAMIATLHPDVVFNSPVVHKPYEGRDTVAVLLRAIVQVLEDFRYVDHVREGATSVLVFRGRAGDRDVMGIDMVTEDADGLITDFTVMLRPLSGILAVAERMKALLEPA